jgi:hypothetical protein
MAAGLGLGQKSFTPFKLKLPGGLANVMAPTGSTNGVICVVAEGEVFSGLVPNAVKCEIFSPGASIPSSPDGGAVAATPGSTGDFTNWSIDSLGGASCLWSATGTNHLPNNELAIWRMFPGETDWTLEVQSFRGQCALVTDCVRVGQPPVFDTVPRALELLVKGFTGALHALNGTWLLPHFPKIAAGVLSWICGGDGISSPRIEVSGNNCGCDPMELHLTHGGRRLVYTAAREAFNPLGENRFTLRSDPGLPRDTQLPTALVVKPAASRA